jgi:hypothetical protein
MELEGLLGLWAWSLKLDPAIEIEDPDTGLTNSIAGKLQARRGSSSRASDKRGFADMAR